MDGPRTLKRPRKPRRRCNKFINYVIFCTLYSVHHLYAAAVSKFVYLGIISTVSTFITVFGVRLLYFLREILCWRQTHRSLANIFPQCMKVNHWPTLVLAVSLNICQILVVLLFNKDIKIHDVLKQEMTIMDYMMCPLLMILMGMYFQWHNSPILESYTLEESFSYSGGSHMALGYYHGYLKIVLPGLLKTLNDFLDRNKLNNDQMPFKKLFILIPSSSFMFDTLRKTGDETLELLEDRLDTHIQNRGLVGNREYRNALYKLKNESNDRVLCYLALEGASPLKTFWEICFFRRQFKEYRREVVSSFYYTLEQLLWEDREVHGLVELIYFEDDDNPDIELADVVRDRVEYLKQQKDMKKEKTHVD